MTRNTFRHTWPLFCVLILPFAPELPGQSSAPPGPLHLQPERQEIGGLLAPDTRDYPVANASNLVDIVVDPSNPHTAVVLGGPFAGQGANAFYVTDDGGRHWSTDYIPLLGEIGFTDPYDTTQNINQYAAGITFDRSGHTAIELKDPAGHSFIFSDIGDTISLATGTDHGRYLINEPVAGPGAECFLGYGFCFDTLFPDGIATDLSGTATDGTIYFYYTDYCQNQSGCSFGDDGDSVLFAGSTPGAGKPFTFLGQVSAYYQNSIGGASAVVDSSGVPHFIYTNFAQAPPTVGLGLDQIYNPLLQYALGGSNNTRFPFPGFGIPTPKCAGRGQIAYCAFNAGSIGTGPAQTNVNVYLATIDLQAGTATVAQVNDDPAGKGKDHFNPSVTVTPDGDVFVGFFDDRRSATNEQIDYFLARSTDGGKTFPRQEPINNVPFPTMLGVAPERYSPGFSGSIAAGLDGVVHAAWTDTRNGTRVQVYSREVKW